MKVFPADKLLPEIWLFESLELLREELGHASSYGAFFPEKNRIYATELSLAHEIAHYKDFKSGRMPDVSLIDNSEKRRSARLRNELVAIFYSWQKTGQIECFRKHERDFLNWFYFLLDRSEISLPHTEFTKLSFREIQDLADKLTLENESWGKYLDRFFDHYLRFEGTDDYPTEKSYPSSVGKE